MFSKDIYIQRRNRLRSIISSGIVLLPGNSDSSINYPHNAYHFRQDSNFLYFFGIQQQNIIGVLDVDQDQDILFGDDVDIDDIIWMGEKESLKSQAQKVGVDKVDSYAAIGGCIEKAIKEGRKVHFLPTYRGDTTMLIADLLGVRNAAVSSYLSVELIKAVVSMRSVKEPQEIVEIENACNIGYKMHTWAMQRAHAGVLEQSIAGEMEGIALSEGGMLSFDTILSQRGQILHNNMHDQYIEKGRLMLVDAGAENTMHYCSDNTRTLPVGGRFSEKQKEVYNIVLNAKNRATELFKPNVLFKEVHLEAAKVIASGLKDLGLMKGDIEEAVQAGAHALFYPHGLGHMMGLDVHDMEGLGQCYVGFDDEVQPVSQFGTANLRLGKRLEQGNVITNEPGIYFIPALIDLWKNQGLHKEFIRYEEIEKYRGFGGIRLEDDYLITENGSQLMGPQIPINIEDVENEVCSKK